MPDPAPWFSTLDADHQAHVTAKGWNALEPAAAAAEAAKAHFEAQKLMGVPADQLIRVPKDAADPNYQAIYDRIVGMNTPKTPEEYKFDGIKFKDGSDLAPEDVKWVRDLAVKYKLPVNAAAGIAADLAARTDNDTATSTAASETTKAANNVALRQAWGADYDQKVFSATRAGEAIGFTSDVLAYMASLGSEAYVKNMNALVSLGNQMQEAVLLRGSGGQSRDVTTNLSADEAENRLVANMKDPEWRKKALSGEGGENGPYGEWKKLTEIIAAGRVPRR